MSVEVWINDRRVDYWTAVGDGPPRATLDVDRVVDLVRVDLAEQITYPRSEDPMKDPTPKPPGYWHGEIAQAAREASIRLARLADSLDAEGESIRQDALAREAAATGTYGGAR